MAGEEVVKLSLGIDPDLHHAGVALVRDGTKLVAVRCPTIASARRGGDAVVEMATAMSWSIAELVSEYGEPDICVVEGQESYLGSKVRPQDLIHLGQAAGVAVGAIRTLLLRARIELPRPVTWKGSVPKDIHQKRILSRLGIPYEQGSKPTRILELPDVDGLRAVKKAHLVHVIDAMGLASWGCNQ